MKKMCVWVSYIKNYEEKGPGSISQRHGSWDPNPDPHENVTDPQH
jgi:hypothetical protein